MHSLSGKSPTIPGLPVTSSLVILIVLVFKCEYIYVFFYAKSTNILVLKDQNDKNIQDWARAHWRFHHNLFLGFNIAHELINNSRSDI